MSVKRVLWAIVIVFVIYAIFNDPTGSGHVASQAADQLQHAFHSIVTFFNTMIHHNNG